MPDPSSGLLDRGTGAFTVAVWIKTLMVPNISNAYPQCMSKFERNVGGWEIFLEGSGTPSFSVWSGTVRADGRATQRVNNGGWHHLVGRKTASEVALYIDGQRVGAMSHSLGSVTNSFPMQFGNGDSGEQIHDFDGQIDDGRFYSRALSDQEIAALASGLSP